MEFVPCTHSCRISPGRKGGNKTKGSTTKTKYLGAEFGQVATCTAGPALHDSNGRNPGRGPHTDSPFLPCISEFKTDPIAAANIPPRDAALLDLGSPSSLLRSTQASFLLATSVPVSDLLPFCSESEQTCLLILLAAVIAFFVWLRSR